MRYTTTGEVVQTATTVGETTVGAPAFALLELITAGKLVFDAGVYVGALCLCGTMTTMNRLPEALGFDRKRLWWYRDIALGTFSSIAALWAVISVWPVF
jgi:hypothetical protein